MTKEEFILKAREKYGWKYDYSKVEYKNNKTKVCIICPEHGEFWKTPNIHLRGQGCPYCSGGKLTREEFIKKAKEVHGDKYDYSKVEYINNKTKVCIICPEHGEFWQQPGAHLLGSGCKKCGDMSTGNKNKKVATETYIQKAKEVHGDFYDYSNTEYNGPKNKVTIYCKKHHNYFNILPYNHLNGQGCPKCRYEKISNKLKKTTEKFIQDAIKIHGDKYDYSKTEYTGVENKVSIICHKHGEFLQRPNDHLCGSGCPKCKSSHLEMYTSKKLIENNIEFVFQKKFEWLKNKQHMPLDFYLPEYNIAIECQGEQHFKPVEYFGGDVTYNKVLYRDKLKKLICKNHNINILYVKTSNDVDLIIEKLVNIKSMAYDKLNSLR